MPPPQPTGNVHQKATFTASSGVSDTAQKIVVYGPGGIGKSKLASLVKQLGLRPIFLDVENGSNFLDVDRVSPCPDNFQMLRDALQTPELFEDRDVVVIDSLTKVEEMGVVWTLENVLKEPEKGGSPTKVNSIEGYGWGKGYTHVYETFLKILGDLDSLARRGKMIICTAHECTANVPNPGGEDWIRYEPRLQAPASGKASIRHRVKEWADHLLFIGYDVAVDKRSGKASGAGTRCIYPQEMPTHWAKSRSLADPIVYEDNSAELWNQLLKKGTV